MRSQHDFKALNTKPLNTECDRGDRRRVRSQHDFKALNTKPLNTECDHLPGGIDNSHTCTNLITTRAELICQHTLTFACIKFSNMVSQAAQYLNMRVTVHSIATLTETDRGADRQTASQPASQPD